MSLNICICKLSHGRASGYPAELTLNYGLVSAFLALIIEIVCNLYF